MLSSRKTYSSFFAGLLGGTIACLISPAVTSAFASSPGVGPIRGSSFQLVDRTGKVRARLSMQDDHPRLSFFRKDGKECISMGLTVNFYDKFDDRPRPAVEREHPEISLSAGTLSGALTVHPDYSCLHLSDSTAANSAMVRVGGLSSNDGASVILDGRYSKLALQEGNIERATIGAARTESISSGAESVSALSSITLFDKEGKMTWTAP